MTSADDGSHEVVVAVMGATGTGKSTFIHLLTEDPRIVIGHEDDSQTRDVDTSSYVDPETGLSVTMVDTPGFDDSREEISDVGILEKIVEFLQAEGGRKLNGIIYMHNISENRVGGMSRKNLRMFESLCGQGKLGNVRIVTTYWDRITEEEGNQRMTKRGNTTFKSLVDAGALLVRQNNGLESARSIMSQLITKEPVKIQVQKELDSGKPLSATGAGIVVNNVLEDLKKKYDKDLEDLKKEVKEAKDMVLQAQLAEEKRELLRKRARVEEEQKRLVCMVVTAVGRNATHGPCIAFLPTAVTTIHTDNLGPEVRQRGWS